MENEPASAPRSMTPHKPPESARNVLDSARVAHSRSEEHLSDGVDLRQLLLEGHRLVGAQLHAICYRGTLFAGIIHARFSSDLYLAATCTRRCKACAPAASDSLAVVVNQKVGRQPEVRDRLDLTFLDIEWFWTALKQLGKLRNETVHGLETIRFRAKLGNLLEPFRQSSLASDDADLAERLREFIAMIHVVLSTYYVAVYDYRRVGTRPASKSGGKSAGSTPVRPTNPH